MEGFNPKQTRVIGLFSHAQAGKTSLAEAILFLSNTVSRQGTVAEGNTAGDYNEDEISRKISINSSLLNLTYSNHFIQIIDTPGYADFIGETLAAFPVVESAVVVIDSGGGIEVGTERVWQELEKRNIPRIIFVNKTDKEDVDEAGFLEQLRQGLSNKAILYAPELSQEAIETIAESDDALLEKYLEQGSLDVKEAQNALHDSVVRSRVFPVLFGSALTGKGVKDLLEVIVKLAASPVEGPQPEAIDIKTNEPASIDRNSESFFGFVFKSISDPYVGQLSLIKIFSGKLSSNTSFYNINKDIQERFGQLYCLQGKNQKPVQDAQTGDIVAIAKLKSTATGDSIVQGQGSSTIIKGVDFPEPALSFSIKPKTRADEEKISAALAKLTAEDPTFVLNRNEQTKELVISGMGDVHLDAMVHRLHSRFHVDVEVGTPKVAYKETIARKAKVQTKYKKQSGGRGQYADVWLEIEPLSRGGDFEFADKIFGGAIPKNYVPSVEKGVRQACREGALAGFPVVDIKVTLFDGSYHDVDSSDMAFQIAGSMALRKAVLEAGPKLLEPIMDVQIIIPDDYTGHISGDLNSRRGRIMGIDVEGKKQKISAQVPLSEMFKYANDLRSITGGRGTYSMRFSHYEEAPQKVTQTVVAASKVNRIEEDGK